MSFRFLSIVCTVFYLSRSNTITAFTFHQARSLPPRRIMSTKKTTPSIRSFFSSASAPIAKKARVEDSQGTSVAASGRNVDSDSTTPKEDPETNNGSIEALSASSKEALNEKSEMDSENLGNSTIAIMAETTKQLSDDVVGWRPFDEMEPGWRKSLAPEFKKPYMRSLLNFLNDELGKNKKVFPPASQLFTAFNLCPLDKVKVVVIGQDPYHGAGQAHGLAFSVQNGVAIPPSLRNMITEAKSDVNIRVSGHGNLQCWAEQGVLMLNTVLTVRSGEANSHQKHGWEQFTDAAVKVLSRRTQIVYLLWGKPAQSKCAGIDAKNNTIITSSHPSPLAAYKTAQPFIGSKCFSRCNAALENYGKEPIDWSII